MFKKEKRI